MERLTNPYLRDAPLFLKRAVEGIAEEEDGPCNLFHALDFALGVERMLKGILWNEHPGYTLADEKFQNMTAVFHVDRLKKIGSEKEKGNADSITYRTAAARARVFCNATNQHYAALMKLGHVRDVIVHNDLTLIDLKDLAFFLRRNLHPVLAAFGDEKLIDADALMGANEAQLAKFAVDYIEDLKERVAKRLAQHFEIYRRRRTPVAYIHSGIAKVRMEQMDTDVQCPACAQTATVREEVDFDIVDGKAQPMGIFILHLRCPFCRMFVDDYEELQEMGITTETLHPPEETE